MDLVRILVFYCYLGLWNEENGNEEWKYKNDKYVDK